MILRKTATSLVFAAACATGIGAVATAQAQMAPSYSADRAYPAEPANSAGWSDPGTEIVTNGPQASPGDRSASGAAEQNVRDSHRYDRMVETSPGFRAARMRQECGPITDPQLHQSCIASFNQDEPGAGPSRSRPDSRS